MAFDRLTNTAPKSPPSSTSSFNPHHSIATTFLNQSLTPLRSNRIASTSSDLHLNLGQIKAYDEAIKPGPSPPTSPQPSPMRRNFGIAAKSPRQRSSPRASVVIPKRAVEPPMTPSRAPSKAAALLGVDKDKRSPAGQRSSSKKKSTNFRPLPSSVGLEIDSFFGDVPRKKKTPPRSRAPSRKGTSTLERGTAESASTQQPKDKAVSHVGEDGSLWLDVEEEQEFAWLLSDVPQRRRVSEIIVITGEEEVDDEDMWGMKAFQSVLNMPKPKPASKVKEVSAPTSVEPSTPPKQVSHLQAFLNVDPYAATSSANNTPAPATSPLVSNTSPASDVLSSSPQSSDNGSPSKSTKTKRRPPPLTLRGKPPTTRLPVLVVAETPREETIEACPRPSKPSISQPRPKTAQQAPTTPFVRPRTAPAPAPVQLPTPAAALQTSPTSSDQSQPRSFFDAPSPVGGFRVSLAKKMKWGIGKVVNAKNPKA